MIPKPSNTAENGEPKTQTNQPQNSRTSSRIIDQKKAALGASPFSTLKKKTHWSFSLPKATGDLFLLKRLGRVKFPREVNKW